MMNSDNKHDKHAVVVAGDKRIAVYLPFQDLLLIAIP